MSGFQPILNAVLDAILEQDSHARVACETYVKTGMVMVGGEITTSAWRYLCWSDLRGNQYHR